MWNNNQFKRIKAHYFSRTTSTTKNHINSLSISTSIKWTCFFIYILWIMIRNTLSVLHSIYQICHHWSFENFSVTVVQPKDLITIEEEERRITTVDFINYEFQCSRDIWLHLLFFFLLLIHMVFFQICLLFLC